MEKTQGRGFWRSINPFGRRVAVVEAEAASTVTARALPYKSRMGQAAAARSFAGGEANRLLADWATDGRTLDAYLKIQLRALRARSRTLARNNDYMRRFLRLCKTNIVGPTGFSFVNEAKTQSGAPDAGANTIIGDAWREFSKRGNVSICGRWTMRDLLNIAAVTLPRDGEVIVRIHRGAANDFKFALELLAPDLLDHTYNRDDLGNGRRIHMGIEREVATRKAIAYHFLTVHPGDDTYGYHGQNYVRVPASEIIHVFVPEDIEQSRGFPWAVSSMVRLHMLGGYEEAELVGARTGASKMGFYKQSGDAADPPADGSSDSANEGADLIDEVSPGQIGRLPAGWEFEAFDPQHPTTAFGDFVKSMLRGASSGLGVMYNTFAGDLEGVSYSSIRAGTIDERDGWTELQAFIVEHMLEPVFSEWLAWGLATRVSAFGNLPFLKLKYFNAPRFQGRRWQWVDPNNDAQATEKALELGLTTRTREAQKLGLDFGAMLKERAEEEAAAKAAGIVLGKPPSAAAPPPPVAEPDPQQKP